MAENTLSVLKITPGQYPQQVEIDNDLKACAYEKQNHWCLSELWCKCCGA